MNQLGEVWGCNLLHKAPITKDLKVKTACNRIIRNVEQTELVKAQKERGWLCKRCFA